MHKWVALETCDRDMIGTHTLPWYRVDVSEGIGGLKIDESRGCGILCHER